MKTTNRDIKYLIQAAYCIVEDNVQMKEQVLQKVSIDSIKSTFSSFTEDNLF